MEINKWKLFHTYNLMVEDGLAAKVLCSDCKMEVVSIIDVKSDDIIPAMYCLTCDTIARPGLDFWDQIKTVVLSHYEARNLQ